MIMIIKHYPSTSELNFIPIQSPIPSAHLTNYSLARIFYILCLMFFFWFVCCYDSFCFGFLPVKWCFYHCSLAANVKLFVGIYFSLTNEVKWWSEKMLESFFHAQLNANLIILFDLNSVPNWIKYFYFFFWNKIYWIFVWYCDNGENILGWWW